MSDQILLSAYQKTDDVDIDKWLMSESKLAKPAAPQPKGEQKAPEPVKPGGFFNTVSSWASVPGQFIADFALPKSPVESPSTGRRVMESGARALAAVPERVETGLGQIGEAWRGNEQPQKNLSDLITGAEGQQRFKDTDIELPGVGKVTVPAGVVRAATGAMGVVNTVFPFSGAAESIGRDVATAKEELLPALTDEALKQQIDQQKQSVLTMQQAGGSSESLVQQHADYVKTLEALLMMPYDERRKKYEDDAGLFAALLSGIPSGYTAAAKGISKMAGAPARAATEAGRQARIAAVAAAGEKVAVDHAAKQTARQAEQAAKQAEGTGGPRPALTLADIRQGMQAEVTPGVKTGAVNAPGSIPESMVTLEKLHARQRLAMLREDPAAAQAIDETIPDARTMGEPGLGRIEGKSERELLREQSRTSLEGGELRSARPETSITGHPYERPSEPLDEQAIKMAQEYDAAVTDPAAKPAWDALARETERMYDEIAKKVKVERVTGQPYASAAEMNEDIARGVFKVTTDNSDHPFWDVDQNWKFRVVHDYLGHFEKNHDFSLKGEKEAYLHHAQYLTDPEAKDALQLEIYGQAAANVAHGGEFQPQKAYITKQPFGEVRPPTRVTAYHGTSTTFDQYKGSQFFAESPETAGYYANRQMLDSGAPAGDAPQIRPVSLTVRNAATEQQFRDALDLMQGDRDLAEELLKSKNYDAVHFEGADTGKGSHYLVFDPNKSAVPLYGEAGKQIETAVEAAKRRIAERFGEFSGERGSVDMRGSFTEGWEKNRQLWNDLVTVGAAYIWDGTRAFKDWAAKMLADYGPALEPKLKELFALSQAQMKKLKQISESDIPSVTQALKMLKLGEHGAQWYDNAWDEIQRMFGKHAETYAQVLAATSPNTEVKANVSMANRAMEMIISGERNLENPFKTGSRADGADGFMQEHADNLNRVLRGEPLGGPKVGPFARALMGDKTSVVVDTWMLRAFGFSNYATQANITFIQRAVTSIAEQLGMDARQVQAAIWTGKKIMDEGGAIFVEDINKTVERAITNLNSPLYEVFGQKLASVKGMSQEGKIQLGTYLVLARTAAFGAAAAMTGDDPETSVRNVLLAMAFGSVLSPKLAKVIVQRMNDPETRDILKQTIKLQGEEGALFPKRKPLMVNESNAGGSVESRGLIRGVNRRLEEARLLARSSTQTHEATVTAALHSPYRTVEAVLGMDEARFTLDELASAKVAAKGVRDFVAEDVIQTAARAKIEGNQELFKEAVDKTFLLGKVSQKVADLETAGGRFVEASKIKSSAAIASKYDLDEFATELNQMHAALLERGKVSDEQLVEMLTKFADKAAAKKIADTAAKWPEALWNIYYGLNLLGSPLTQARNMLGNLGALGMAVADRGFGELVALPFHAAGKGQNMVQLGETYELATGIYEAIADSFRGGKNVKGAFGYARDAYKSGESIFGLGKETDALNVVNMASDAGEGTLPRVVQVMATLAQKNLKFMGGTDEFYKVLSFNAEIRALARRQASSQGLRGADLTKEINRLVNEPTTEMLQQATYFAKENTFTKAFTPGTLGSFVESAAQHPFMRVAVTPFYRTPVRIAEFSTVHTPILNLLAKQTWSDMFGKNATAVSRNMAAAKIMTGTAALGLVSWFAIHGYVTGDPPSDPQLRSKYELAGWKPRSVYNPVNGKYYSYANLEPLSTLVSTAANMVQITRDLPEWDVQNLLMAGAIATSKSILSKQWFQGLSDLSDVIEAASQGEDVGKGLEFIHRRLASLIPGAALGRFFNTMTDEQRRELKTVTDNENPELREFSNLVSIYTQNIPGWGHLIPGTKPRPAMVHMVTGEPIANENTWLGAISPIQVSTFRNDKVLNELVALEGAGLPREIPRVIGGSQPASPFRLPGDEQRQIREGVILNEEERQRLGVLLTKEVEDENGNTLHAALRELIESDDYDDASDGRYGGKAAKIATTFNYFLDRAEEQLREEYPKIDQIIARRQLERGLGKLPKSMDDIKDFARESLEVR